MKANVFYEKEAVIRDKLFLFSIMSAKNNQSIRNENDRHLQFNYSFQGKNSELKNGLF